MKGSGETGEYITVIEKQLFRELHLKMETNNEQQHISVHRVNEEK